MAYMQHRTLLKRFCEFDDDVIAYFDPCKKLLEEKYFLDVIIAFMFSRLEVAHRETLCFGAMKHHDVDRDSARNALEKIDLSRPDFRNLFKHVYGYKIPHDLIQKIQSAEVTRDKILHGKIPEAGDKSKAILNTIDYFDQLNSLIYEKSGVWLAGSRHGMFGRKRSHNRATSKWILMGLGFLNQPKDIAKIKGITSSAEE